MRWAGVLLGWAIIISAPIIGILPGPGGLILFPIGLGIVLKNSLWAKRRFTQLARAYPAYGHWINWAMRRKRFSQRPPFPPMRNDLLQIFRRDDGAAGTD